MKRFLIENGYLEGKVEQLPAYSAQQPVTPEEAAIFNAACGDYQYPLGTPVTVGNVQPLKEQTTASPHKAKTLKATM